MDGKLIVNASRVDPEGEEIEGEVAAVDLAEEFVKPFGGVRYRLALQLFGTELLVRGSLEQDFSLVCCRCGKDFDETVKVDDFTVSYEIDENSPEVDLTADVRESIILNLPTYPVCAAACPGISQKAEVARDDRWDALNGLKVGDLK